MKSKALYTSLLVIALLLSSSVMLLSINNAKAAETLVWTGNVSSSGSITTGPVLTNGAMYRIEATEIFWWNYPAGLWADAQYYEDATYNVQIAPGGHSFLQIDGQDVYWGAFNYEHVYSVSYVGTGSSITFQIVDWVDNDYSNNNCHLPVSIYQIAQSPGFTPGFWKHNIGVYLGINNGNYSAFEGGPLDGVKCDASVLGVFSNDFLQNAYNTLSKGGGGAIAQARADMANYFNAYFGYGPFVD